jgi:hypothetical protein
VHCTALLALPALASFCGFGAEPEPPQVPWDQIEAWVAGTPKAEVEEAKAAAAPTEPAAPAWTPSQRGERRPEPQAYKVFLGRIGEAMGERLAATLASQSRRRFEIFHLMERYEDALRELALVLRDPKRFQREHWEGWAHQQLWETLLLTPSLTRPELVAQHFEEWKDRRQKWFQGREQDLDWVTYYKKHDQAVFDERQDYYLKNQNIAEIIRDLDPKGDTSPEALWDLCRRYHAGRPRAPLSCLRTLCKLREWFPDYPQSADGEVQMRIVRLLRYPFAVYREAALEAERLMEFWPRSRHTTGGEALFCASENWLSLGDALKPEQMKSPAELRALQDAREAWEKSRAACLRLQKEYPKHHSNDKPRDPDGTVRPSLNEKRLWMLNGPDRLGAKAPGSKD